jgi:hypothetical protein
VAALVPLPQRFRRFFAFVAPANRRSCATSSRLHCAAEVLGRRPRAQVRVPGPVLHRLLALEVPVPGAAAADVRIAPDVPAVPVARAAQHVRVGLGAQVVRGAVVFLAARDAPVVLEQAADLDAAAVEACVRSVLLPPAPAQRDESVAAREEPAELRYPGWRLGCPNPSAWVSAARAERLPLVWGEVRAALPAGQGGATARLEELRPVHSPKHPNSIFFPGFPYSSRGRWRCWPRILSAVALANSR